MIFQNRCQIKISPEDAQLARKALCIPDMIDPETDLVIGEADVWDGSRVEVRLCGTPGQPAFMAAAVFSGEKLLGFARSETYTTAFELRMDKFEYLVTVHEAEAVEKKAVKIAEKKTPPRPKRHQRER